MTFTSAVINLTCVSCFLTLVGAILHAVAFGTPNWLESDGRSPFVKVGFHFVCFDKCRDPYCPGGDQSFVYDGCHWIYDEFFRELWKWIMPDWYMTTRNLTIINVPLSFCCFILALVCSCIVVGSRYVDTSKIRNIVLIVFLTITSFLLSVSGIIAMVTFGRFYSNAFNYGWMPLPEKNHLGYSFWLEVVAVICLLFAFLGTLLAVILKGLAMRQPEKPSYMAEDMMMGVR